VAHKIIYYLLQAYFKYILQHLLLQVMRNRKVTSNQDVLLHVKFYTVCEVYEPCWFL